jgi:Ca-activated chloride channel homolog
MRKGILSMVLIFGWLFGPPSDVQNAKEAFLAKKYSEAATLYTSVLEQYASQHPSINFNIGQSWLFQDSTTKATAWFGRVTNGSQQDPQMASWAWNQIGTVFATKEGQPGASSQQFSPGSQPGNAMAVPGMQGKGGEQAGSSLDQALQAFKDALKLDHDNDIARYNYELIKRKIQQQQQQQQQQEQQQEEKKEEQQEKKPKPDQNKAPKKENQGGQQGEPQDTEQMSPQEAERILEAMNSNEKKFLQQLEKRKKHRTYNNDGPDW